MNGHTRTSGSVSEDFLEALTRDLDQSGVEAIALGGSQARGDATGYSDVDIACIVTEMGLGPAKRYHYREGRLVSITRRTLGWWEAALQDPMRALYTLPSVSSLRILVDHSGRLTQLQAVACNVHWDPYAPAVQQSISDVLRGQVENIHKVLSSLSEPERRGSFDAAAGRTHIVLSLVEAMAAARGVLANSGELTRWVLEAVGPRSRWSRLQAEATETQDPNGAALATIELYLETVDLLHDFLQDEARQFMREAVRVIREALAEIN